LLGLSQAEIAQATGLSVPTIKRAEADQGIKVSDQVRDAIQRALEAAGVEFTDGDRPGVRTGRTTTGPDSIPRDELNASNDD